MNFWNRELVTGLDYIWDFVDNVSPCRLIPHSSEKVLSLNKGEINMSEVKYLTGDPA